MPFIIANKINIYYEILENKTNNEAKTIFLLGGLSRDHRIWHKVIPELDPSLRIVIMDNRGAGQTDKPDEPYSIEIMANDVISIIENLGLDNVILVGHSMGSFIAGYVAAKRPDLLQQVILLSCAIKQVDKAKEYLNKRIELVRKKLLMSTTLIKVTTADSDDIKQAMPNLYSKAFLTPNNIDEILKWETANPYPQPAHSFIRQAQACIEYDGTSILPLIKIPTTIIYGANDLMYTKEVSEELARVITQVNMVGIEAAHMIQIEQPKDLAEHIHIAANLVSKKIKD